MPSQCSRLWTSQQRKCPRQRVRVGKAAAMQADIDLEADAEIDVEFGGERAILRQAARSVSISQQTRDACCGVDSTPFVSAPCRADRHRLSQQQIGVRKRFEHRGADRQMEGHEPVGRKRRADMRQQRQAGERLVDQPQRQAWRKPRLRRARCCRPAGRDRAPGTAGRCRLPSAPPTARRNRRRRCISSMPNSPGHVGRDEAVVRIDVAAHRHGVVPARIDLLKSAAVRLCILPQCGRPPCLRKIGSAALHERQRIARGVVVDGDRAGRPLVERAQPEHRRVRRCALPSGNRLRESASRSAR